MPEEIKKSDEGSGSDPEIGMQIELEPVETLDEKYGIKGKDEVGKMDKKELEDEIDRISTLMYSIEISNTDEQLKKVMSKKLLDYTKLLWHKRFKEKSGKSESESGATEVSGGDLDRMNENVGGEFESMNDGQAEGEKSEKDQEDDAIRTQQEEINEARKKLYEEYMKNEDADGWKEQIEKEKSIHGLEGKLAFLGESFWKKRGEAIVKNSGLGEAIGGIDKQNMVIVDIGSGKQHINNALLEANPGKNIKVFGFDQSDKAAKRSSSVEGEKVIESVYGIGEALPVKNESADVVKFDFTLQGASEKKIKAMLSEAKDILKKDGIITVIDHLKQENKKNDLMARLRNLFVNKGMSEFDKEAKSQDDWTKIFKDNGLEIVNVEPYREDGEVSDDKPAQYISFVLKKKE